MKDLSCWGIFREETHSPGRESDDAEILRLTAKHLEAAGFQVNLKTAEEVGQPTEATPRCVFLMCERVPVLRQLQAWQADGMCAVNDPMAVLNTYRDRMIDRFAEAGVPFIESRLVSTGGRHAGGGSPVWVKRADVHNTQEGDVVFAATEDEVRAGLAALAERGIGRAVLQPHIAGDLIKFYGIGPGEPGGEPPWFRWFYHKGQRVAGHPFDPRDLARLVRRAAAALGLEIYGGDVIITANRDVVLLDLNAWPSFALYREEASVVMAAYLARRFRGGA